MRVLLHQDPCKGFSSHKSSYLHNLTKPFLKFCLWFSPSQMNTLAAALPEIILACDLISKLLAKLFIYIMFRQIPTDPFAALQITQVDLNTNSEQLIIIRFPAIFFTPYSYLACYLRKSLWDLSKATKLSKISLKAISSPHLTNQICRS